MKLALFRSHIHTRPYQFSMPPLGLGYIASWVKKACWYCEIAFFQDLDKLIQWRPDIVGISSATENFSDAVSDAKRIKEELGVPVWIGGSHITVLPHTLPDCFDVGIVSEGEATTTELVKLYYDLDDPGPGDFAKIPGIAYHDQGEVRITPPRPMITDMDELRYPDRELLGDNWALPYKEQSHMITSRGCPYDCIFCSAPVQWKKVRYFSPEYVAGEIEFLREKYDPNEIFFFDDLFIGHVPRFRKICELIRERGLHKDVVFRTYGRADLMEEAMADLFAELNFLYLDFGFESNSLPVLQYLNKKNVTPEKNQKSIDLLAERGISIGGNFIIGSPHETLEQMKETRDFVERNKQHLDRCSMGPLQPVPGTKVWDYAKERGLVSEDMDWSRFILDFENLDMTRDPYLCETMSVEEFMEFYRDFHRLATKINLQGEVRRLSRKLEASREREKRLESKLMTLNGSRLVRLASRFRKKV